MATSIISTPSRENNPEVVVTTPHISPNRAVTSTPEVNFSDDLGDADVSNVSSLKEEYETINKTLDFLLNFNCSKRKPGRPKTGETNANRQQKIPDTVNEKFKSISNVTDLHGGVLLDYLLKVNSLNKKLLSSFEKLNDKYVDLSKKFNQINLVTSELQSASTHQQLDSQHNSQSNSTSNNNATDKPDRDKDAIELKIDNIEQRANENFLFCSGTNISNALNTEGGNSNIDQKAKFVNIIQTLIKTLSEGDFRRVNVFGRNKNVLKVECTSIITKNKLLYEA